MKKYVVYVDDERGLREVVKLALEEIGYKVWTFDTAEEALDFSRKQITDLWIVDLRLPGMQGLAFIQAIREQDPFVPILIVTAHASLDTALEALRMRTNDYMTKPFNLNELIARIQAALEERKLLQENMVLRHQLRQHQVPSEIIVESPAMVQIFEQIDRIAPTPLTVIITGESGVGKEIVARLIHDHSERRNATFTSINCAAVPPHLLETELFGHVKGAFTGAIAHKKGLFEAADGGTLFLDEIGDMPLDMQAKLLRVLEQKVIRAIGSIHEVDIDVRLVAATNQNLEEKVKQGRFREDLYFRLHVVHLYIPPLRERQEDILPLSRAFLVKHARIMNRSIHEIDPETTEILKQYKWPGNVRELENAIVRSILMETHSDLHPHALPPEIVHTVYGEPTNVDSPALPTLGQGFNLEAYIHNLRRQMIIRVLRQAGGSRQRAAEKLGVPLRSLKYYMHKYKLFARDFRKKGGR